MLKEACILSIKESEKQVDTQAFPKNPNPDRNYPWGDKFNKNHLNHADVGFGATSTVGCFPLGGSPYGIEEMSGNVWEWCLDGFDEEYYKSSKETKNHQGPSTPSVRVLRGGSFADTARNCRSAFRSYGWPNYRRHGIGFRLVREVP